MERHEIKLNQKFHDYFRKWPLYSPRHVVFAKFMPDGVLCVKYGEYELDDEDEREWEDGAIFVELNITPSVCYLLSIEITKKHRGKGHGRQLYEIVETIAKDLGCDRVEMKPSGCTPRGETRAAYLERLGYVIRDGIATKELNRAS